MRLAEVGRAFIGRPSLVLLDEPAAGIDPVDKVGLVNAVESLLNATDDVTFLLIEHDMSVVRKLTRSAVAIASGSVTVRGRVEDVLSDPQVVADFLGPDSGSPGVDETKGDAALNQEEDSKRKGEDL
jgi:ABC-type branched-subunit amino acid transport system ATPase component